MSRTATYSLAHTAHCKLRLAADRPDRNLRFLLGHAVTLDKLRLRIAEIETDPTFISDSDSDSESEDEGITKVNQQGRRVSFGVAPNPNSEFSARERRRSPPPDELGTGEGLSDGSDDEGAEEEDAEEDEGEGLSLQRFGSAAATPPRMIADADESDDDDDEDEPKSPEMMPSEGDLQLITGGVGDGELKAAYNKINGCPCHGKQGPVGENVWEIPGKVGEHGGRLAVIQIAA